MQIILAPYMLLNFNKETFFSTFYTILLVHVRRIRE